MHQNSCPIRGIHLKCSLRKFSKIYQEEPPKTLLSSGFSNGISSDLVSASAERAKIGRKIVNIKISKFNGFPQFIRRLLSKHKRRCFSMVLDGTRWIPTGFQGAHEKLNWEVWLSKITNSKNNNTLVSHRRNWQFRCERNSDDFGGKFWRNLENYRCGTICRELWRDMKRYGNYL